LDIEEGCHMIPFRPQHRGRSKLVNKVDQFV
jgi:hypothetical protein